MLGNKVALSRNGPKMRHKLESGGAEYPDGAPLCLEELSGHSGADGRLFILHHAKTGAISCNPGPRTFQWLLILIRVGNMFGFIISIENML